MKPKRWLASGPGSDPPGRVKPSVEALCEKLRLSLETPNTCFVQVTKNVLDARIEGRESDNVRYPEFDPRNLNHSHQRPNLQHEFAPEVLRTLFVI